MTENNIFYKISRISIFLFSFLIFSSFLFLNKSTRGSENSLSQYLILHVPQTALNIDPIRLEKAFPGTIQCYYAIYAHSQFLKPDPSDSDQKPLSSRKRTKGVLPKSPDCKTAATTCWIIDLPALSEKFFYPVVLLPLTESYSKKHNIRPPPLEL